MIDDGIAFVRAARRVREHLDQQARWAHVVGVTRTADRLAAIHGEDARRARIAGLLHDLARLYSGERLIRECTERGLAIDAFERAYPVVLHARLGAELARDWFGIDDEAILSAIRTHTLGSATMSRLDAVVYLADALEPGRDSRGRAELLALAERDLDAALGAVLVSSVEYLTARNLRPAPQTLAAIARYAPQLVEEKRSA